MQSGMKNNVGIKRNCGDSVMNQLQQVAACLILAQGAFWNTRFDFVIQISFKAVLRGSKYNEHVRGKEKKRQMQSEVLQ